MIDANKLECVVNEAICRLTVCEGALWDINQEIPGGCELKSSYGTSAEYVYFGVMNSLRSIRESLEAAVD